MLSELTYRSTSNFVRASSRLRAGPAARLRDIAEKCVIMKFHDRISRESDESVTVHTATIRKSAKR